MKYLDPIALKPGYYEPIEAEINRIFERLIFRPLLAVLNQTHPELHNAMPDALVLAIKDGTVWYQDGKFAGQFNSRISAELVRIGAVYNARSVTWTLPLNKMPPQVSMARAHADSRYDALRRGLLTTLGDLNIESIDQYGATAENYGKSIEWMDDDFKKSVSAITIAPVLTPVRRKIIAKEWGQNLDLYIKDWAALNILNLRERIQEEAFKGHRAESMEAMIIENYGVSRRKAKFLARQETSLLMSKFHETRYHEVGIDEYKWSTSHDERVRKDHARLNGKICRYSSPPVTNRKTGARNNPGEDFGCRCLAIPCVRRALQRPRTPYMAE